MIYSHSSEYMNIFFQTNTIGVILKKMAWLLQAL